jgi:hypothetical protein
VAPAQGLPAPGDLRGGAAVGEFRRVGFLDRMRGLFSPSGRARPILQRFGQVMDENL